MEEGPDETATAIAAVVPALAGPAKTRALKAFSQLLGGVGSLLTALLRRPVQAIEDKTDAISLITRKVAAAAADKAAQNPEIIDEAIKKWLPTELRKQKNKEIIVESSLEVLKLIPDSSGCEEEIDSDWLNTFERFAEDASSEKMQKLWARVLAGEIANPGSFSRRTLRFLFEIDQETAAAFGIVAHTIFGNSVITEFGGKNEFFAELLKLESAGVIAGASGSVSLRFKADEEGMFLIPGKKIGLVLLAEPDSEIIIQSLPLTQIGIEICTITSTVDEKEIAVKLAEKLRGRPKLKGCDLAVPKFTQGEQTYYESLQTLWGNSPFSS